MRAEDLHLAVKIIKPRKQILITGAIDTNDATIVARYPIPEPGLWTFIKAETNLTDETWHAWQITLGEGVRIPDGEVNQLAYSRQFSTTSYNQEYGILLFRDGEVRPGDSMLKIYTLECTEESLIASDGMGSVSHNRIVDVSDLSSLDSNIYGLDKPKIEVKAPYEIIE